MERPRLLALLLIVLAGVATPNASAAGGRLLVFDCNGALNAGYSEVAIAPGSDARSFDGTRVILVADFIGSGVFVPGGDSNIFFDSIENRHGSYSARDGGILAENVCGRTVPGSLETRA